MNEPIETPEDVERQLVEARSKLQAFEDGVDRKRLLLRLKTASPAHPVLLFRGFFLVCTVLLLMGAVGVLATPVFSEDLARTLAKFDAVVPVPEGIPGLPALLGVLALLMGTGWLMTSLAAYAMGRDAQMLPWEQKTHQKLVNEVTRLTTQKAVMERIRGTPAGARPRIATPVPVSLRDRGALTPMPTGPGGGGGLGPMRPGGFGPPPPGSGSGGGGFAPRGAFGRGGGDDAYSTPPQSTGGYGGSSGGFGPPPSGGGGAGGGGFGGGAASGGGGGGSGAGFGGGGGAFGSDNSGNSSGGFGDGGGGFGAGSGGSGGAFGGGGGGFGANNDAGAGVLGRARSGQGGMKITPAGAAGRLSPNLDAQNQNASSGSALGGRGGAAAFGAGGFGDSSGGSGGGAFGSGGGGGAGAFGKAGGDSGSPGAFGRPSEGFGNDSNGAGAGAGGFAGVDTNNLGANTRGGTPLGSAPRPGAGLGGGGQRLSAPIGFPGTPETGVDRHPKGSPGNMFGTPPPVNRSQDDLSYGTPADGGGSDFAHTNTNNGSDSGGMLPDIVDKSPAYSGAASHSNRDAFPQWGRIDDMWLEEALQKAEDMAREFPTQARLEFSQEAHLPFTLIISRSTPAMAVRSMVAYVEFLASICTPPRARIELQSVAALDRSFHRNVESALAPYFSGKFTVEAEPGRVEILFKSPDPGWQDYPMLPIRE